MPPVSKGLRALTEPPGWGVSVSRSGEFQVSVIRRAIAGREVRVHAWVGGRTGLRNWCRPTSLPGPEVLCGSVRCPTPPARCVGLGRCGRDPEHESLRLDPGVRAREGLRGSDVQRLGPFAFRRAAGGLGLPENRRDDQRPRATVGNELSGCSRMNSWHETASASLMACTTSTPRSTAEQSAGQSRYPPYQRTHDGCWAAATSSALAHGVQLTLQR